MVGRESIWMGLMVEVLFASREEQENILLVAVLSEM